MKSPILITVAVFLFFHSATYTIPLKIVNDSSYAIEVYAKMAKDLFAQKKEGAIAILNGKGDSLFLPQVVFLTERDFAEPERLKHLQTFSPDYVYELRVKNLSTGGMHTIDLQKVVQKSSKECESSSRGITITLSAGLIVPLWGFVETLTCGVGDTSRSLKITPEVISYSK